MGIATDFAHTGDKDFFLAMRDKALGTLEWMDRDGDLDGDGFYEYRTLAGDAGIKNQGWKDSGQAILHEGPPHGARPDRGLRGPGPLLRRETGDGARLRRHRRTRAGRRSRRRKPRSLKAAVQRAVLDARKAVPGPGTRSGQEPGGDERGLERGTALAYGIVDDDKAAAVAERLMAPDMFSGWGVRTLSSQHPAYNPLAYHLGTVWPFANALTGYGLKRYGFDASLHRLAKGLFDASEVFHLGRLPEVFGGHPRDRRHPHPGIYPAPARRRRGGQRVIFLVHAMLGITPLAPAGTLIVDPSLPDWLPEATLEGIRVGRRKSTCASGAMLRGARATRSLPCRAT